MLKMKKIGLNLTISFLIMGSLSAMEAPRPSDSSSRVSYPEILKTSMVPLDIIKEEINKNKANIEAYASNLYTRHSEPGGRPFSAEDDYAYTFEWNQFDITIHFNGASIMKFFQSVDNFKQQLDTFLKKDDINIKKLFLIKQNKEGKTTGGEHISVTYDYTPLEYLFDVKLNIPSGYENCTIGEKKQREGMNEWVVDTWFAHRNPSPPFIQCKLSAEGLSKRTLKGLSLDKIIADFRAGMISIETLQKMPLELRIKLPPDIQEKLPKEAK